VRAFLGRRFSGRRFFLETVHLLDQHEDREGHDGEIQDGVDEHPVFEGDRLGGLGFLPEGDGQIGKIDIAHDQADGRHDDVLDQGADNLAEGAADDDADRHVNNVAAHGKLFEFLEYLHVFSSVVGLCCLCAGDEWFACLAYLLKERQVGIRGWLFRGCRGSGSGRWCPVPARR